MSLFYAEHTLEDFTVSLQQFEYHPPPSKDECSLSQPLIPAMRRVDLQERMERMST
jgi:hypothetical protein